ncbi:MAG: hypothetical protein AB1704_19210 [Pseudomonadota bacterium]|uniref:hypothetical protein n=1 Tax=Burkholderiaceae TaxID=119060 RepID=UPI0010F8B90F|nr:hypothetical protein [Burkholderia sp. 4M9327F10]
MTLAARLPSCPSCGASQLDPLGWYPPAAGSASARLAPPPGSNTPQLAAPAAWQTPAGVEDDRFYAKHDPWRVPKSYRWAWVVGALAVALLAFALAAYFVLRPATEVSVVAPKAVSGAVTAQQAGPSVVARAVPTVPMTSAASTVSKAPVVSVLPKAPAVSMALTASAVSAVPKAPVVSMASTAPAVSAIPKASTVPTVPTLTLARPAHPSTPASAVAAEKAPVLPPPPVQTPPVARLTAPALSMPNTNVPKTPAVQAASAPAPVSPGAVIAQNSPAPARVEAKPPASSPEVPMRPAAPPTAPTAQTPRTASVPPPVARHETKAAPAPAHPGLLANQQTSQQAIQQANLQRNLQIARAMLQRNDLSAAGGRLAAVLTVQPKNRDALAMHADLTDREQQRDTALDVARGCENIGRWTCAWHSAGSALVLDSSSAEARQIIARAMYEEQIDKAQAAPMPPADPAHADLYHH